MNEWTRNVGAASARINPAIVRDKEPGRPGPFGLMSGRDAPAP
jgi:hypothetical protein